MGSRMKNIHNRQQRKFMKKQKKLASSFKFLGFWSAMIIIATMLTTGTGALVNDTEKTQGSIHVAWDDNGAWDKSSLEFIGETGSCKALQATVSNGKDSEPMDGPVDFEVYYVEKGPIKKGGKIIGKNIFAGKIPALGTGEKTVIEAIPSEGDGKYMFRAFQRPGHPGKGELWSDEIVLNNCQQQEQDDSENQSGQNDSEESNSNPENNGNNGSNGNQNKSDNGKKNGKQNPGNEDNVEKGKNQPEDGKTEDTDKTAVKKADKSKENSQEDTNGETSDSADGDHPDKSSQTEDTAGTSQKAGKSTETEN
ncbi:amyloid fiber anchoring/assembly protein TapA [Virgibacillus sp. MSP4-1]|uniref:amyloid fiber anchoring/assembly protein TapA n=1 Tax=Virgibacillus sp. MSP4-1 TaxID=2700081 RepID=UPI0005C5857E|nr:amyloid fiber anchoring/assembly protein TapA [Virgibacillus sp. MSP4-1]QHS24359.1 amyloid fiber anchoring/assembly protein TapA [Virgibacillus sp. MSP4-1]